ncbi:hypothetical protein GCM10029963_38610 [Micromonospora andamanensis]
MAAALAGVILVTAGVQLRSRPDSARARAAWDRVIVVGSLLAALGWGVVLAGLLQGVPLRADGHVAGVTHLFTPFAAATGLAVLALVVAHGATFLTLRLPTVEGDRLRPLARRLLLTAIVAVGAATVAGLLSDRVRAAAQRPRSAYCWRCYW